MTEPTGSPYVNQAQAFFRRQGRTATTILAGGVTSIIGCLTPFAHINNFFGGGTSISIIQCGFYGLLAFLIALALAAYPIVLKQYIRFRLAAFGVSCLMLGIFLASWIASNALAGTIGSVFGGTGPGLFFSLVGYAVMVYGYYRWQSSTV